MLRQRLSSIHFSMAIGKKGQFLIKLLNFVRLCGIILRSYWFFIEPCYSPIAQLVERAAVNR